MALKVDGLSMDGNVRVMYRAPYGADKRLYTDENQDDDSDGSIYPLSALLALIEADTRLLRHPAAIQMTIFTTTN